MAYQAKEGLPTMVEEFYEEEFVSLGTKRPREERIKVPKISQAEADEAKRRELDRVLLEQH